MEILKEKCSITDLSRKLGVADHTLRYYEREFNLNIPRDSRGRRYYTENGINIMHQIKNMRDEGLSIKEIKKSFNSGYITDDLLPVVADSQESRLIEAEQSIDFSKLVDDFKNYLTINIKDEITASKEQILKEMLKTKLELGACMENNSRKVEMRLEKHFNDVDNAIGIWRKKKKSSLLKRIFNK